MAATKSEKQIIHLTLVDAFSFMVLVILFMWMLLEIYQGNNPLDKFMQVFKTATPNHVDIIFMVAKGIMLLMFAASGSRLIYSVLLKPPFLVIKRIFWDRNIFLLTARKILTELEKSHLKNQSSFYEGIRLAKKDEETLIEKSKKIGANPAHRSDWALSNTNAVTVLDEIQSVISKDKKKFLNARQDSKKRLEELCSLDGGIPPIKFYTASVQTSILLTARKLVKDCKINDSVIDVLAESNGGPETVNIARKVVKNREDNGITIFAAPLSAFAMAKSDSEEDAPTNFFYPICSLIDEEQTVLVVENGQAVPFKKGHIHYYDNSTAEEHFMKIREKVSNAEFLPVDGYENYTELLESGSSEDNKVEAGDGIIVWQPLTDYYYNHDVSGGYFVVSDPKGIMSTKSKIMLYCDKASLTKDGKEKELVITFIKAFLSEFGFIKRKLSGRFKTLSALTYQARYLSSYTSNFRDLVK